MTSRVHRVLGAKSTVRNDRDPQRVHLCVVSFAYCDNADVAVGLVGGAARHVAEYERKPMT